MSITDFSQIEITTNLLAALNLKKKENKRVIIESPRSLIVTKLNDILQNEAKSKNLEISIFNWTLNYIKDNKIIPSSSKNKFTKKITINNNELSWNNNRFKRVYLSKFRSISFNLMNEKNKDFKKHVLQNIIKTQEIVNMTPQEIFPRIWEPVFQKQLKKEMIRIRNDGKELEQSVEGNYTCSKCNCKKINYYELQTRSADEPMTAYFTCLNCQHRWKE